MTERRTNWTTEQDEALRNLINIYKTRSWALISEKLNQLFNSHKNPKQCRERWNYTLNPQIIKREWTEAEKSLIITMHRQCGSKWSAISKALSGRTDNDVKNQFYAMIRKSLRRLIRFFGFKRSSEIMRELKPVVLSQIFSLAQQSTTNPADSNMVRIIEISKELERLLMEFALTDECAGSKSACINNHCNEKINEDSATLVSTALDHKTFEAYLDELKKMNTDYEQEKEMKRLLGKRKAGLSMSPALSCCVNAGESLTSSVAGTTASGEVIKKKVKLSIKSLYQQVPFEDQDKVITKKLLLLLNKRNKTKETVKKLNKNKRVFQTEEEEAEIPLINEQKPARLNIFKIVRFPKMKVSGPICCSGESSTKNSMETSNSNNNFLTQGVNSTDYTQSSTTHLSSSINSDESSPSPFNAFNQYSPHHDHYSQSPMYSDDFFDTDKYFISFPSTTRSEESDLHGIITDEPEFVIS